MLSLHTYRYARVELQRQERRVRAEMRQNWLGQDAFRLEDWQRKKRHGAELAALWRISRASPNPRVTDEQEDALACRNYLVQSHALNKGRVVACPLCHHAFVQSKITACSHCTDAGAVLWQNKWFASDAERITLTRPMPAWIVSAQGVAQREIPSDHDLHALVMGGTSTMKDGLPVLMEGPCNFSYHQTIEHKAYDDTPCHVGIELEYNRGRVSDLRQSKAAILYATDGAVSIENDATITGFELISGHGAPSSVRQALSPIFRLKLLDGLSVGKKTGGHVHVTKGGLETPELSRRLYYGVVASKAPLALPYQDMAERAGNGYCKPGVSYGPVTRRAPRLELAIRENTVEFRLFRSQSRLAKVMRNAQFAWASLQYIEKEEKPTLDGYLGFVADLPRGETLELRAWLAAKGHKVPFVALDLKRLYRGMGLTVGAI